MSEKHDAMWGAEAGKYIAQQIAEIQRLRAALNEIAAMGDEDDEWDGRDKFRNARSFARHALELEA